jgi:hypothetical protein
VKFVLSSFRFGALVSISLFVLVACKKSNTQAPVTVQKSTVTSVSLVSDLTALGAKSLNEAQILSVFVGKSHDAGDWIYTVNSDGTWSAESKDGSWDNESGTWELKDDQFCRVGSDFPTLCSTVYQIGNILRVTTDDEQYLRPWSITL